MESSSKFSLEKTGKYVHTTPTKNENKNMGSRRSLFMHNPILTDLYKVLGEIKLPP